MFDKKDYKLTGEERKVAIQTGRYNCPECKEPMQFLVNDTKPQKPEFYCPTCHVSVRCFTR